VDDDVVMASGETGRDAVLRCFTWADGHADVWRVFDDGGAFASVIEDLVAPWRGHDITKVCGVESRGFILGGAAACALGTGFVAIRKRGGLFPGPKLEVTAAPDYRGQRHVLQIQMRSLITGDRVLLVDDWVERGSQATATHDLVQQCGASLVGCSVMVDQLDSAVRSTLPTITSIVRASELRT
jgi:adenine phosphoribosyltransferase